MVEHRLQLGVNLKGLRFLSAKAGSFSRVPQRTVQAWTEAGLVLADTRGTGDRRRYSVMGCIEIAIIKALRDAGLDLSLIGHIMHFLRKYRPSNLERLLADEEGFLVVKMGQKGRITPQVVTHAKARQDNLSVLKYWKQLTLPRDCDQVLVVNITRIANRILSRIKSFLSG